ARTLQRGHRSMNCVRPIAFLKMWYNPCACLRHPLRAPRKRREVLTKRFILDSNCFTSGPWSLVFSLATPQVSSNTWCQPAPIIDSSIEPCTATNVDSAHMRRCRRDVWSPSSLYPNYISWRQNDDDNYRRSGWFANDRSIEAEVY